MEQQEPPRRSKRRHAPEVKAEAVRRVLDEGEQYTKVAAEFGIDHRTVWVWIEAARNRRVDPNGEMSREAIARVRALERENAALRRDLAFAKKWAAFSREISNRGDGSG